MSARLLHAGVLVVLAAVVAATWTSPSLMVSPGALSEGHADLAEDCFACHAPFRGSSAERCRACHEPTRIGLFTTAGEPVASASDRPAFHQSLVVTDCTACHSDHRGVQPFRPAARFDHDLLAADLSARCASCHQAPRDTLHPTGTDGCARCHATSAWRPSSFDHDELFRFDREHPANCVSCHQDGTFTRYDCYGCHEHSPGQVLAEHREEGLRDIDDCARCHRSGDEHDARRSRDGGPRGERDDDD